MAIALTLYCLHNSVNGKEYVGQTRNPRERFRQHRNGCKQTEFRNAASERAKRFWQKKAVARC